MQFFANVAAILLAGVGLLATQTAAQLCTPTGPGVCNVAFQGNAQWFTIGFDRRYEAVSWYNMNIYDNTCRIIGFRERPKEGNAVTSELPYTIVINRLVSQGDYNWINFCYAGKCQDGGFACERDRPQAVDAELTCRKAFDC
ncbi:hypothetical protein BJ165DRAFT_1589187 [Panaeolus papilionaceus]|nr:hypothetical protein BJ165DRAFT_1589187 [Panaeolus papilionaceus]